MGSKAPLGVSRNMPLICKLFAVIVIIQASGLLNAYAKDIHSEVEDTFDIDQLDDTPTLSQKLHSVQDLEDEALLEDELQPVEDSEETGWFATSVKRVRRELGRLFGKDATDDKHAKEVKPRAKRTRAERLQRKAELEKKRQARKEAQQLRQARRKNAAKDPIKHNKRSPYDLDYIEGSGHFIDNDGDNGDPAAVEIYRTLFTVHEPWSYGLRVQGEEFEELQNTLDIGFKDLLAQYDDDEDTLTVHSRLLSVVPTTDRFKVHVIVQLELPRRVTHFEQHMRGYIAEYQRLGSLGAEIDDQYYFRHVRDVNEPIDYGYQPSTDELFDTYGTDYEKPETNDTNIGDDRGGYDESAGNEAQGGAGTEGDQEYNCDVNPSGFFLCRNGQTVECARRCDNYIDCDDETDEEEEMCNELAISAENTTDNIDNDVEPDEGYNYNQETYDCDANPDGEFMCRSGERIPCYLRCNSYPECQDGSDEAVEICGRAEDNGATAESEVNPPIDVASGDGDEDDWLPSTTETSHLYSRPTYDEDEAEGCRGDATFICPYSFRRICDEQRCDGEEQCPDGEDEIGCPGDGPDDNNGDDNDNEYNENATDSDTGTGNDNDWDDYAKVCNSNEFKCDDRCLPLEYQCNGVYECIDRTDEENCPERPPQECQSYEYRCRSGDCIDARRRCDRTPDCPDGDDEDESCRCASNQFRCRNGDCVPEQAQCNGYPECRDGSDEEECTDPTYDPSRQCLPSQFRCENGQCVNGAARCNGYTDCHDSSDERYCTGTQVTPAPQLNLKTYPDSQIIKESREVVFRCRDEGPLRAQVRWSRADGRPLPPGFADKNGRLEIPNIRVSDSGKYICEAVGYPRHVPGQQVSVHLTVEPFNPNLNRPPSACNVNQATCMNGECIDKSQICDGIPHCSDGSDEHSCSHGRKCHPNQFMCRNSKCVDRIWRCDGENDCGDNSDEDSCDPEPSGAPCRYDEFQCRSGHCIPKSFQCDDTNDCVDASDEIGCMVPVPIRPPPPRMNLKTGESLNLTCVATGVPVPVIVWRLNWGHVPEKCTSKSYAGTGNLYCPNMEVRDSGAYSCEIINNKGTTFVTPDTLVTVEEPTQIDVCPAGFFNMLARRRDECISCFCFGITKTCRSANLYNYAIKPPITSHRVVNVELNPNIIINEIVSPNLLTLHHGVQFRASDIQYGAVESPYLALPSEYMGNQLKSYGGYLRYEVNYVGNGRPTYAPDVIITGNGYTLTNRARSLPQPNINNKMSVQFTSGNWQKPDGRFATREEIMMILANVDNILIRLGYIDATEREVELTNIVMDSAGLQDQGLGSASLVEQCTCPVGYVGDSCETCAPGYVRQPGGPWLGRCVPFLPEPCAEGTYGDPRRGIPCRECPCPLTGSQNFASGCQMGPDGEVTCNCYEGYAGRRCEMCAPGYQGNPLVPGGSCHRVQEEVCNAEGTYYPYPNGTCECKPLVVGPRCDTCAPESFHLNSFTYTGCIECFCSGLTKQCSSSSWYRNQVSSNFGRSRAPHGFNLIRNYETSNPSLVTFEESDTSLQFSQQMNPDPLYWSLPPPFLGDKVTAYGGKLNYTLSYNPLPGGLMSRNNAPDVVIKSGEDLTIIHYRKAGVNPSQSTSYAVPIIESAWQRSDGQVVNREHLLMALSKIEAIYIKATYTTSTRDGALTHVSLDTATETNIGTQRALEVEECRCPVGYIGLSCERCAPGYKRDTEAGLYLGLCEPCECNGHSSQCDGETGVCLDCADNTEGEFCERCAPGYVGNPAAGTPYDCSPDTGSSGGYYPPPPPGNQTTCQYCNQAGTSSCANGYCYCKQNVMGTRCDQCRPGTYGLSERNPDGCSECYCSGKSQDCRSASLYRQLIPVDFISNPPELTDDNGISFNEKLDFDLSTNMYIYSYPSYTPKYWSLRGSVLGNQLYSYGGELSYNMQVESFGNYETGNDVILIGNGIKLLWSRPDDERDNEEYRVRLHEDENWTRLDRGQAARANRLDFMGVLANLEHILIRATPKIPTTRTSIRDVILESAVERAMPGAQLAAEVEVCSCPNGYIGNSCEKCAPLYYRDSYDSCVMCPCQEETSIGCAMSQSGYVECKCHPGYTGQRCETLATPEAPTIRPTQPDYETQITVSIAPPEITIIPVGGSLTLFCTGHLAWNGNPVVVSWYKLNGQLPYQSDQRDGVLRLYDLQIYDSGVYICQAVNNATQKVFEDQVSITISEQSQRTPAQITNLPTYVTFEEFQVSSIDCVVSGNPEPRVTWTRVDGQMSYDARTEGSRLVFQSPRLSDEGNYRCQANNGIGSDEKYTQIYVRQMPTPQPPAREFIYIEPPSFTGQPGEYVRLTCQPTTSITLVYEWNKDGYPIYRQRNLIINGNQLEIREASPRDSGLYTCVGIDKRSQRNYTSDAQVIIEENRPYPYPPQPEVQPGTVPPTVNRLVDENRIVQGQDFSITCEANGTPYPSIKWTKVHEALAENVQQTGNVLRIINARPENRGMYICIAENSAGSDQSSTIIDVEPRERPTIDIHPSEPQTHYVGSEGMLYCTANGIPEPSVQWRRVDRVPLSPRHIEESPGYMRISDIQIADAGDYECIATNDVGEASGTASIRVIEAPIIMLEPNDEILRVTEGDEVKITCSASGFPSPNVYWVDENDAERRDYQPSVGPIAYLDIYRVTRNDAKSYKCVATNEAGTDERYITVDVSPRRGDAPDDSDVERYPYGQPNQPASQQRPPYSPPQNVYRANAGDLVTLTCDLQDVPELQTRWERVDGRPLPVNSYYSRNSLIIQQVKEENSGQYRCNALDPRGSVVTFVIAELVLVPIPHITFHPKIPIVVSPTENVEIYCEVTGEQPITVSWHTDNNRPLPPSVQIDGQYLRFVSITPADAGRYYCSASNRYGNTTNMAEVLVNRGNAYAPQPQTQRHNIAEGGDVTLTCDVQYSREPIRGEIRYDWRREDGRPLPVNAIIRNDVLYLRGVRKQDEGRYVCESYSTAGGTAAPSYVDLYIKREYPRSNQGNNPRRRRFNRRH